MTAAMKRERRTAAEARRLEGVVRRRAARLSRAIEGGASLDEIERKKTRLDRSRYLLGEAQARRGR